MTTAAGAGARRTARRAASHADLITKIGRFGLVAYGVVYLLIAFLAIKVAVGDHGEQANKNGALATVAQQPFGKVILWIVAVGLAALALWRLSDAIWGYRYAGKRRTGKRVVSAAQAVIFAVLAVSAGRVAAGGGQQNSGKAKTVTAKLLDQPFGQVLVGLIGAAIVIGAIFVIRYGLKKKFVQDLDFSHAKAATRKAAERFGQVGYSALGAAYGVVGVLVVIAAVNYDPDKAAGLDGAIQTIAAQPYGAVLLWAVALGLACYGVYCFFEARFRR